MSKHTPTPWNAAQASDGHWMIHESATGKVVHEVALAHTKTAENAAFIVQACNAHADLVAALSHIAMNLSLSVPLGCDPESHYRGQLCEAIGTAARARVKAGAA